MTGLFSLLMFLCLQSYSFAHHWCVSDYDKRPQLSVPSWNIPPCPSSTSFSFAFCFCSSHLPLITYFSLSVLYFSSTVYWKDSPPVSLAPPVWFPRKWQHHITPHHTIFGKEVVKVTRKIYKEYNSAATTVTSLHSVSFSLLHKLYKNIESTRR